MPWSRSYLTKEESVEGVMEYVPQKFALGTPEQALSYIEEKRLGSDFKMADTTRVQTGVLRIEEMSEEERIEKKTLEKVKDIQEPAYKEAYELGKKEGLEKAFSENAAIIAELVSELEATINTIKNLKGELIDYNEAHLVKMVFHFASRLALRELQGDPSLVIEALKAAGELAMQEERVTVQVSARQFEFLEDVKKHSKRELEFIKHIRFEPNDSISPGGCVIETNYGEIDSTVEERVSRLWETLQENMTRVKDKLAG